MANSYFDPGGLTELPFGLNGHIYRSQMPFRAEDPQGNLFQEYQSRDINTVVMLVDSQEAREKTGRDLAKFYSSNGMEVLHCPIQDFNVPDWERLVETLDVVTAQAQAGHNIVVHCNAGIGRTGTFLACLAKKILGFTGEEAVEWVRGFIPHAMENIAQVEFVLEFKP